jgi:PTH1 family peptidyl-tRNA hydrolase
MTALPLKVVVGLGNPGAEHEATRHNAGFWFVDELARRHGGRFKPERRYGGDACRLQVDGQDLWLLKPMTYMNRSGLAIRSLCDYLDVPSAELLVAHDELDLPPGVVRLKRGGGAGGHNGLKDSISHLGADFWRLRLGIGHPGNRDEVIDYVLRRPSAADEQAILDAIRLAADEFPRLFTDGAEKVMNRLHGATPNKAGAAGPDDAG